MTVKCSTQLCLMLYLATTQLSPEAVYLIYKLAAVLSVYVAIVP